MLKYRKLIFMLLPLSVNAVETNQELQEKQNREIAERNKRRTEAEEEWRKTDPLYIKIKKQDIKKLLDEFCTKHPGFLSLLKDESELQEILKINEEDEKSMKLVLKELKEAKDWEDYFRAKDGLNNSYIKQNLEKIEEQKREAKRTQDLLQWQENPLFETAHSAISSLWDNPEQTLSSDSLTAFNSLPAEQKKGLIWDILYSGGLFDPDIEDPNFQDCKWTRFALAIEQKNLKNAQNVFEDLGPENELIEKDDELKLKALINQLILPHAKV